LLIVLLDFFHWVFVNDLRLIHTFLLLFSFLVLVHFLNFFLIDGELLRLSANRLADLFIMFLWVVLLNELLPLHIDRHVTIVVHVHLVLVLNL
jgi:hypothetical protein